MKEKKPKKPLNKYLQLSGIGLQMGATIYFAIYFGKKLDEKYPSERNWFTIVFTLVGVALAMYSVVVQTKKFHK